MSSDANYRILTELLGRVPTLKEFMNFDFSEYNKTSNSRRTNNNLLKL
jgi:hypothetical protein